MAGRHRRLCNQDEMFESMLNSCVSSLKRLQLEKPKYLDTVHNVAGYTLLSAAVERGATQKALELIEVGCDPNQSLDYEHRPLQLAITNESKELVHALLTAGARVEWTCSTQHSDFHHCLIIANTGNVELCLEIAQLLIDFSPLQTWKSNYTGFLCCLREILTTDLRFLLLLRDAGLDPNIIPRLGVTGIAWVIRHASQCPVADQAIQTLVDCGTDVVSRAHEYISIACSVVHMDCKVIKVLLDNGAYINVGDHRHSMLSSESLCREPLCILLRRSDRSLAVTQESLKLLLAANIPLYWHIPESRASCSTAVTDMEFDSPFSQFTSKFCGLVPKLAEFLLQAGARWQDIEFLLKEKQRYKLSSEGYSQPWTLSHICRIMIRRHIRKGIKDKVPKLELPHSLHDFLLMKDILS